ncbi:22216_t:CDS:2 [Cetraspora pellucida]|uniref:22216_t:CDS:1 n=1 Tax=Cetraspora pellucida TaxID=1433469 RepID=A0A9N9IQT1_9GLOM|nr:22216_t:CDS:2 [Cetraspora pellucida]
MSNSEERLNELEVIKTKLDISIDLVSSVVDSWLPPLDPGEQEKEKEEERRRENQLTKSMQELHATRVGGTGSVKYRSTSEKKLKRKLIQRNIYYEDDNLNNNNGNKQITRENKSEDEDDSKTFATCKKSKLDSATNYDEKTSILKNDFLSLIIGDISIQLLEGFIEDSAKAFAKDVFINQDQKLWIEDDQMPS